MEQPVEPYNDQKDSASHSEKPVKYPVSPMLYQLRKYFVYVIVGGLIISALIAIIAVLIGNMTGIIGKSISTVFIIIFHSLLALAFISTTSTKQPNKGSAIVINTMFVIVVLSLITALIGTWEIITDDSFMLHQYTVFVVAIITSLIIYGLFQSTEDDKSTILSRNTAIGSSLVSFVLLLPILYDVGTLPDFYYRVLTAVNIVVGVSIVITVIFHWYYVSKHPELKNDGKKSEPISLAGMIGRGILILFLIWILVAVFSSMYRLVVPTPEPQPYQRYRSPSSRYY